MTLNYVAVANPVTPVTLTPYREAADLLTRLRYDRGLSRKEAAAQMGVSEQALSRAEAGATWPQPAVAKKMANFYGLRTGEVWPTPIREYNPGPLTPEPLKTIDVECGYCGHTGPYPTEMEIRADGRRPGRNIWACIDPYACDERDLARRGE